VAAPVLSVRLTSNSIATDQAIESVIASVRVPRL
jgi:hypothetical protein